jgi:steroid delta-isomerase-like uncharacterized protein
MNKNKIAFFVIFLIGFGMVSAILLSCVSQEPERSVQKNKNFITTYTEEFWNKRDFSVFDNYYSDEFIVHFADGDQNREQYKKLCEAYFSAYPDLQITTDLLVSEGDKITKVWTANCTHQGDFMGIPATQNKIVVKGIEVFRIVDGKIVELWASMDNLGMMQQLGVIPPMDQ